MCNMLPTGISGISGDVVSNRLLIESSWMWMNLAWHIRGINNLDIVDELNRYGPEGTYCYGLADGNVIGHHLHEVTTLLCHQDDPW